MLIKANDELYLDADSIKYIFKDDFENWQIVLNDGSTLAIRDKNVEKTLMNLANKAKDTPLKDQKTLKNWRDSSRKYYIKIKGLGKKDGYLNYDMKEDRYFTDDNSNQFSWAQVIFSVDEIDRMISNPYFFLTENNFDPIPVD